VRRKIGMVFQRPNHLDLPPSTRRPLLVVGPVLFAAWRLLDSSARSGRVWRAWVSGSDSRVIGGLAVLTLARAGELTARAYGIAVFALAALAFAGLARPCQVETASATAAGVRAEPPAAGCPCMG
jgi:hypothetical protein